MGVLRGNVGLARVQRWFEHIYGLDLQVEWEGVVLPSLEATLSLHEGKVGLRLKTKVNLLDNSERRIVRFPDRHSVNAKEAVKSIVIGSTEAMCVKLKLRISVLARQKGAKSAFRVPHTPTGWVGWAASKVS